VLHALRAAGGVLRHVVGGRYGLGSKDFTPAMAKAVYDNLKADKPKDKFTVRKPLLASLSFDESSPVQNASSMLLCAAL
jgi:hypothetical protein